MLGCSESKLPKIFRFCLMTAALLRHHYWILKQQPGQHPTSQILTGEKLGKSLASANEPNLPYKNMLIFLVLPPFEMLCKGFWTNWGMLSNRLTWHIILPLWPLWWNLCKLLRPTPGFPDRSSCNSSLILTPLSWYPDLCCIPHAALIFALLFGSHSFFASLSLLLPPPYT